MGHNGLKTRKSRPGSDASSSNKRSCNGKLSHGSYAEAAVNVCEGVCYTCEKGHYVKLPVDPC